MIARVVLIATVLGLMLLFGCGGESSENESQETASEAAADSSQETGVESEPQAELVIRPFNPGTPEAELQSVITDVISYLESGNIDGMLDRYIPPEDLEALIQSGRYGRVARRYGIFKDDMTVTLKEALTLQPTFNEDTTRVTYDVKSGPTALAFVKKGDRWYFPER